MNPYSDIPIWTAPDDWNAEHSPFYEVKSELYKTLESINKKFLTTINGLDWWKNKPAVDWDINCGWCEEWAEEVCKSLGIGEAIWLDQIPELNPDNLEGDDWAYYAMCNLSHVVYFLNGKYYDSQTLDGITDIKKLDFLNRVSRNEFLARGIK